MAAEGMESVSFFFPAYHDEKSLPKIVPKFHSFLKKSGRDFELIVVNDASPDKSGEVAEKLAKKLGRMRVIHHEKNMDYGGALTTGFLSGKKEFVGFTDGDAQYSVEDLPKFMEAMQDADLVIGYRTNRVEGFQRKFFQKIYKLLIFLSFGFAVKDLDCSYNLARRKIFDKITLTSKSGFFSAELVYKAKKAGFKIAEVPVKHLEREFGSSQCFGFNRIKKTARDLLRVRLETLFSKGN